MNFTRDIEKKLLEWKDRQGHKPLILRGARQVGKTSVVNSFGKQFDNYLYASLENKDVLSVFDNRKNVEEVLTDLCVVLNVSRKQGSTLLFLDEIQNSSIAVSQLRYFYEQLPAIHVIAAGSLLESMLDVHISFPVGRVEYLAMRPVSFREYLSASGLDAMRQRIEQDVTSANLFHSKLISEFNRYALIGGMPEIVKNYIEKHDVISLNRIYNTLLQGYKDDVEKYARNRTMTEVLRFILDSAWTNAGAQLSFANAGRNTYKSREVGEAFRTLEKAMLLELTYPTTSVKMPYIQNRNRSPKLFWLDCGLVNANANIQREVFSSTDLSAIWKGAFAEQVVAQELLTLDDDCMTKRKFWVNEKNNSTAEIDLLYQYQSLLIPIEVKSGHNSHLRSLHQFMEETDLPFAVRVWPEQLSLDNLKTIGKGKSFQLLNIPYYMVGFLPQLLEYYFGIKPFNFE